MVQSLLKTRMRFTVQLNSSFTSPSLWSFGAYKADAFNAKSEKWFLAIQTVLTAMLDRESHTLNNHEVARVRGHDGSQGFKLQVRRTGAMSCIVGSNPGSISSCSN